MSRNRFHPSQLDRISKACFETLEDRRLMSFSAAVPYTTTSTPRAIVTADFNQDGNLDLAAAIGYDANTRVSVRLGNGAGGFGAASEFAAPVAGYGYYFFVADLNNDSSPDVVVSDGINGYSTLIGKGDGTFQPFFDTPSYGLMYAGHLQPGNAVAGIRTWIGADWETHVQLQWANGQGGFTPAGQDAQYWNWSPRMTLINLNDDPYLDVVTGEGLVFRGEIWGLSYEWNQVAPLRGGSVATGDFTGDGYDDVVVAGDNVAVLRSKRDGTLDAPVLHPVNGAWLSSVATTDFNADGKLDVVVTENDTGTATVMLGNGDGTLRYAGTFATGTSPSSVAVGDFNRDGRPDVAVANSGSANFSVLLNDGSWTQQPPPLPPTITISDATVTEGNTGTRNATFTLTLSKPSAVDVTVHYDTANLTATAGSDYNAASGTLTIPAGQTSGTFSIAVRGDRVPEPSETFAVNLNLPSNATIIDAQGVASILDDEPRISINNVSKVEGNGNSTTTFTFTVSLSAAYDQSVTVNYATANGTARANNDYTSRSGTLTFAPGETIKTISVVVNGDRAKESNETFFVNLLGPSSNSLISVARGTGTILDDDSLGWPVLGWFRGRYPFANASGRQA